MELFSGPHPAPCTQPGPGDCPRVHVLEDLQSRGLGCGGTTPVGAVLGHLGVERLVFPRSRLSLSVGRSGAGYRNGKSQSMLGDARRRDLFFASVLRGTGVSISAPGCAHLRNTESIYLSTTNLVRGVPRTWLRGPILRRKNSCEQMKQRLFMTGLLFSFAENS